MQVLQLSTHQEARVAGGHVLQDTLGAQPSTPRRQCNSSHNMVKCVVSTNVPIHAVALSSRCTGRATCPADHAMRRSHPISCFRQGKPRNASCLCWWTQVGGSCVRLCTPTVTLACRRWHTANASLTYTSANAASCWAKPGSSFASPRWKRRFSRRQACQR